MRKPLGPGGSRGTCIAGMQDGACRGLGLAEPASLELGSRASPRVALIGCLDDSGRLSDAPLLSVDRQHQAQCVPEGPAGLQLRPTCCKDSM